METPLRARSVSQLLRSRPQILAPLLSTVPVRLSIYTSSWANSPHDIFFANIQLVLVEPIILASVGRVNVIGYRRLRSLEKVYVSFEPRTGHPFILKYSSRGLGSPPSRLGIFPFNSFSGSRAGSQLLLCPVKVDFELTTCFTSAINALSKRIEKIYNEKKKVSILIMPIYMHPTWRSEVISRESRVTQTCNQGEPHLPHLSIKWRLQL